MGKAGKGKGHVSAYIDARKVAYLELRRARLNWRTSATVEAIIDHWLASGAPPLIPLDLDAPAYLSEEAERAEAAVRAERAEALADAKEAAGPSPARSKRAAKGRRLGTVPAE